MSGVLGPGGQGKTRLGQELATRLSQDRWASSVTAARARWKPCFGSRWTPAATCSASVARSTGGLVPSPGGSNLGPHLDPTSPWYSSAAAPPL